jgi:hypothetical protein
LQAQQSDQLAELPLTELAVLVPVNLSEHCVE